MPDIEKAAGISSAAVEKATGQAWSHWVGVLDRFGVAEHGHRPAAAHLDREHGLSDWWSQMLVVGYERLRGLRERHEKADGFSASISRTLAVEAAALDEAWRAEALAEWLPRFSGLDAGRGAMIRAATKQKGVRITWLDGTNVIVAFYPKSGTSKARTQLTVQHDRLPNAAAVQAAKRYWDAAIAVLAARLKRDGAEDRQSASRSRE